MAEDKHRAKLNRMIAKEIVDSYEYDKLLDPLMLTEIIGDPEDMKIYNLGVIPGDYVKLSSYEDGDFGYKIFLGKDNIVAMFYDQDAYVAHEYEKEALPKMQHDFIMDQYNNNFPEISDEERDL